MVSAFRGLNEIIPVRHGAGVVMDWKQSTGILLVGGDSRVIKAWDAGTETQGLVKCSMSLVLIKILSRTWIQTQTAQSQPLSLTTVPLRHL